MNNFTKIISNMEEKIKNFSKKFQKGLIQRKKRFYFRYDIWANRK